MFKKLAPPIWASERAVISMFGFVMIISWFTGPDAETSVMAIIGLVLITLPNLAWHRWQLKRRAETRRLRTHQFSLYRIRNPAEEAAVRCGTPYPTMQLMLEDLSQYLRKTEDQLMQMVTGGQYTTVAEMFDYHFPDEYQLEFYHDPGDNGLPWGCVLPRSSVRVSAIGLRPGTVMFPRLEIDNDGQVHFGDRAIVNP